MISKAQYEPDTLKYDGDTKDDFNLLLSRMKVILQGKELVKALHNEP